MDEICKKIFFLIIIDVTLGVASLLESLKENGRLGVVFYMEA